MGFAALNSKTFESIKDPARLAASRAMSLLHQCAWTADQIVQGQREGRQPNQRGGAALEQLVIAMMDLGGAPQIAADLCTLAGMLGCQVMEAPAPGKADA